MAYRTDLALESFELLEKNMEKAQGFIKKEENPFDDIKVTKIEIINEEGEKAFKKPKGNYITIEVGNALDEKNQVTKRAARALSDELSKMVPFNYYLKVLVVGLGNEKVTPDSLGPNTIDKVKITSHLFKLFNCDGDFEMANVSGFNPSVTGVTGMETCDLICRVVDLVQPEYVIVVDSLAAKNIDRLSTTIQLSDTGIWPGAGMGNHRKAINEETVGKKVISIGVPTVIDSKTLILEAWEEINSDLPLEDLMSFLEEREYSMVVTSTEIDEIIRIFSDIISNGINISLHPGIYS